MSLLQTLQSTVLTAVCHLEPQTQSGDQLSWAAPSAAITALVFPFTKCLGTLILRLIPGSLKFIASLFLQPSELQHEAKLQGLVNERES